MKRWLTVPRIGSGTDADPYRPDLRGAAVRGFVAAAYDAAEVLVVVARDRPELDKLRDRPGVRHHADAPLDAAARSALAAEAARLHAGPDWQPDGYDVHE